MRDVVFPKGKQANYDAYGYAAAVRSGGFLFVSGQVGVDAQEQTVSGGMREQTEAALDNIERVLAEAGGTIDQVIMLRIFIREDACSPQEQDAIAAALLKRFPVNPPPSSWILIHGLARSEWLIEIEAEAMLD